MAENNDLSGWMERVGILSPSQKAAQRMKEQQQQFVNQLATIQAQQQQQQNNLKAGELSTGFGYPTYMINQGFSDNPGEAPIKPTMPTAQPYQSPAQDAVTGIMSGGGLGGNPAGATPGFAPPEVTGKSDSMSARFARAAQAALKSDPYLAMQFQAEALRARQEEEKQAREAEDQDFQRSEEQRKRAQAGNPSDTYTFRRPNGNIVTARDKKDSVGRVIGQEILGEGPNRQEVDNLSENRTKAQVGEDFTAFQTKVRSGMGFFDAVEGINKRIDSGEAKTGWVGNSVSFLDNALSGTKQILQYTKMLPEAQSYLDSADSNSKWQKISTTTAISKSRYAELVFQLAAAQNKGGAITKKDVQSAEEQLGASLADPQKAKAVLNDVADRLPETVRIMHETAGNPELRAQMQPLYESFKARYAEYQSKRNPGSPANAPDKDGWVLMNGVRVRKKTP